MERPLLRALPAERVRRVRDRRAAGRREVAGHGPPEPLLGPGRAGRAAGRSPDRRPGDHDQPRRPGGRPPRAAARPVRDQRPARPLPRAARSASPAGSSTPSRCAQERDRGALAGVLRRAVGRADRPLRTLGGRPADGRRAAALPRARPRPASSSRSAARSPPARTTAARSRSSPAAHDAPAEPRRRRSTLDAAARRARAARARPRPTTTSCSEDPDDDTGPQRADRRAWRR